ncbi:hypothetical protein DICPUDRAFT_79595 [Dictyostelium purpureum]|uniref:Uncharacterized protein n=1 Tax=Dictyostelium purpureum TaxID=5786 RepID=F0ZN29_DICPU|nr:uncharacterized protein DICPUDRAFT_79595 [Dictyostelium purpureum]EGC34652.1 hypothetical protein DICPUDRAFT_79595 [Dictyostelium purpureum]|eukprot:XP_003288833.1 hypothetical protein DICPUDRAFT_79595 [Dictyostelium purpureum]
MSIIVPGRFDLVNKKFDNLTIDNIEKSIGEYNYVNNDSKDLKSYHILDLSGNVIFNISLHSISTNFSHITELYLINNELKEIPQEINTLINLKKLYVSKNKLESISNINKLEKLEILDLRANRITQIKNIENNLKLNYISLSNNLIESIDGFPILLNLETLFLFSNQIKDFNSFCKDLKTKSPNVSKLLVENNPMLVNVKSTYIQTIKESLPKIATIDFQKIN